jgi:acetyl-CoA carboxylase carboxyltransferase component
MGSCTAGGAYLPAMSDETIIVKNTGTIFLGGPPLVRAATGEIVTAEELGGADVHTRLSGVADYFAENDEHALHLTRSILATVNPSKSLPIDLSSPEDPLYDVREIYGLLSANRHTAYDVREIIARITDASRFAEFKALYAPGIVTGFARIKGFLVGIVGNNGTLDSECALKATHFVELCNVRCIPLIFLRLPGFTALRPQELRSVAKNLTKMTHAVANSTVPSFVIDGASFGARDYAICGRAFDPRVLWTWPVERNSETEGEKDVPSSSTVNRDPSAGQIARPDPAECESVWPSAENRSSYYSTAMVWDDGILDPADTRDAIALGISVARNEPSPQHRFGVFRM